jgi:hypothetical protein
MTLLRWAGAALVAGAIVMLPIAIWVSERWGIVAATTGLIGLFLLGIGFSGRRAEGEPDDGKD